MTLAKNLKQARVRMGKSQLEVAATIGISNAALSNYETGYREPDLDTLKRLAVYYNVSLDELADLKEKPEDPVYDLWALAKSKQIAFNGKQYRLKDSQKQFLRRQLGVIFNHFDPIEEETTEELRARIESLVNGDR
ncbi:MAG: helix-turn-helix transcriptional regulator [Veillonellaceae bacterium]|nr:helix-turn-helix transcriptional regulator [Veillonellaceae bacterium]